MAQAHRLPLDVGPREPVAAPVRPEARQAYMLLYFGFVVAPIAAGADKFFDFLAPWHQYLAPIFTRLVPVDAHTFMMGVGIIEIVAGLIVAFNPRVGGYIVAAWLWGIVVNLLLIPGYFDIALRDSGLSLGALALARLASRYD
jgi:hypothetical protein